MAISTPFPFKIICGHIRGAASFAQATFSQLWRSWKNQNFTSGTWNRKNGVTPSGCFSGAASAWSAWSSSCGQRDKVKLIRGKRSCYESSIGNSKLRCIGSAPWNGSIPPGSHWVSFFAGFRFQPFYCGGIWLWSTRIVPVVNFVLCGSKDRKSLVSWKPTPQYLLRFWKVAARSKNNGKNFHRPVSRPQVQAAKWYGILISQIYAPQSVFSRFAPPG